MICAPWRSIRSSAAGSICALDGRTRAVVSMAPTGFDPLIEQGLCASALAPGACQDSRYLRDLRDGVCRRQRDGRVDVLGEAHRNAVVQGPHVRRAVAVLLAVRAQPPADAAHGHDPVAFARHALELDLEALPALADALEEAPDAVAAGEVAAVGKVLRHAPADVLVEHGQELGDVTPPERAVHVADGVRG